MTIYYNSPVHKHIYATPPDPILRAASLFPSQITGVMKSTMQTLTTTACNPNTTPTPLLAIQLGWKYPTEKPPQVRHMLIIALTIVA